MKERDAQLKFIASEVGIDASPLNDAAVKKLCQYVLNSMALENPLIAKHEAKACGLTITLKN